MHELVDHYIRERHRSLSSITTHAKRGQAHVITLRQLAAPCACNQSHTDNNAQCRGMATSLECTLAPMNNWNEQWMASGQSDICTLHVTLQKMWKHNMRYTIEGQKTML